MTEPDRWFTTAEAARIADVAPARIRLWIHRGHLGRDQRGLISGRELLDYLDGREATGRHDTPPTRQS